MNQQTVARPDVDITEDIRHFVRTYDPLKQAQHHLMYTVQDGHVTLRGHVRSMQARRVFVDNIPHIDGVTSLDASAFYDDETLRLQIGQHVPAGVIVRVNYGQVVLTGPAPQTDIDALVQQVKQIPGVTTDCVMTRFY